MLDQSFSPANFNKLLVPSDFAKYGLPLDHKKISKALSVIANNVSSQKIDFDDIEKIKKRDFEIFRCKTLSLSIVLRKLDDNIKRLYKVNQSDRFQIVKQARSVLEDAAPISIIRMDIKNFYESINRGVILDKINEDYLLTSMSKTALTAIFNNRYFRVSTGLPRGIGLSATLSELYIRQFDRIVRDLEGVLYYARYVDDILIISFKNHDDINNAVKFELSTLGLQLNLGKHQTIKLANKGGAYCSCVHHCVCGKGVDYLGYRFSFPKGQPEKIGGFKPRFVEVDISPQKVAKIKTRLARTFLSYVGNKEFQQLANRIRYLTSNYVIPLSKKKNKLRGGIHYNYPLINTYRSLEDLDVFYRKLLYAKKGAMGIKLNANLTSKQRNVLKKYSFVEGHKNRITARYSAMEIGEIKGAWKYE